MSGAKTTGEAWALANRLGAKWYRQFDMHEDPRLFDLRADLLLLVQLVTGPTPVRISLDPSRDDTVILETDDGERVRCGVTEAAAVVLGDGAVVVEEDGGERV